MRFFLLTLLLAATAACQQPQASCERSATAVIAFSGQDDKIDVRTFGPSCDKAVGVLVVSSPEGHPLYTWAAPLHPTFGNLFEARADGPTPETVDEFLARWAALRVATTAESPPWADGEAAPAGAETTLDRALYDFIRARALPMSCHLSGVARESCFYYEPAAAAASPFLDRDVIEAAAPHHPPNQP